MSLPFRYLKWSLIVYAQYLLDPFMHKITIGSAIIDPSAPFISLSLACADFKILA